MFRDVQKSLILFMLAPLLYAAAGRALADDPPQLQSQSAVTDDRQIQTAPLQGRVNINDAKGEADNNQPLTGAAATSTNNGAPQNGEAQTSGDPNLQELTPHGGSALFHLAGRKYTTQEFRDMKYGVVGLVALRPVFGGKQTVIAVYPGCPAAVAGIRPGDIEIQAGDHVLGNFENQRSTWNSTDGEAGTPVDITVRRGHEIITFHLVRMNIEDIPNERVRRGFERLLEKLGPPSKQSLHD